MSPPEPDAVIVRPARPADRPAIVGIYNHYVRSSHATFDTRAFTVLERDPWFGQFRDAGPHRLLVAERGGVVAGWASSTRFRPKPAYERSVETTVYLAAGDFGAGLGRRLYAGLLESVADAGAHRACALIALPNPASLALHEGLGFSHVGTLSEVGFKFGRYWDVAIYERVL